MGQKVHPTGFRLGIATDWTSKWYADSADFADFLAEDLKIREFLKKKLSQAAVSRIQISRPAKSVAVTIHTARPGIIIGKKGEDIESLRNEVAALVSVHLNNVKISIEEIRKPELDAQLVAEGVPRSWSVASCFVAPCAVRSPMPCASVPKASRLMFQGV